MCIHGIVHVQHICMSSVPGNVVKPSDGHAAVHRRRLQGGSAGGEETLLLPGGQTLLVFLPDRLFPRQGTEDTSTPDLRVL